MKDLKFFCVAAVAIFSLACVEGTHISKSADKFDLGLLIENGANISSVFFKSVNGAFRQVEPNIDAILNEITAEVRIPVKNAINSFKNALFEEEKRLDFIFKALSKAREDALPVSLCTDKFAPDVKKMLIDLEKGIATVVGDVTKAHKTELENFKSEILEIFSILHTFFETDLPASVKCLVPGKKDSEECLKSFFQYFLGTLGEIVMIYLNLSQNSSFLDSLFTDIAEKLVPVFAEAIKNTEYILNYLGHCVTSLQ